MKIFENKNSFDEITDTELKQLTLKAIYSDDFVGNIIDILEKQSTRYAELGKLTNRIIKCFHGIYDTSECVHLKLYMQDIEETLNGNFPNYIINEGKVNVNTALLAEYFIKRNNMLMICPPTSKDYYIYLYSEGKYKQISETVLDGFLTDLIRFPYPSQFENLTDRLLNFREKYDVCRKMYRSSQAVESRKALINMLANSEYCLNSADELNVDMTYRINVKNGMVCIDPKTFDISLKPHSPKYKSTVQLPVVYNTVAMPECPQFLKYINTAFKQEQIPELLTFLAFTISNVPANKIKKALFLQGITDSGKSVLIDTIRYLLGNDNCFTYVLKRADERFTTSECVGKRLGYNSDLTENTTSKNIEYGLENFKRMSAGDSINVEKKGKQPFSTTYNGALIIGCNAFPNFNGENSSALYNRMLLIEMNKPLPETERIHNLRELLQAERDGIFALLLTYLQTLIADGFKFAESDLTKAIRDRYIKQSSAVSEWFAECCSTARAEWDKPETDRLTVTEVYYKYKAYCTEFSYIADNLKMFKFKLERLLNISADELINRTSKGNCFCFEYIGK